MSELLVYLVSGVALGCSFALIGSGFVVVHRVTHVINFAQGSLAVFGGLISASLLNGILPPGIGQLVTVLVCGIIGLVVGVVAIGRPGTPPLVSLLITLGVSIFASAVMILLWGQDPISAPGIPGAVEILGARIEWQRLLIMVVTILTFAGLAVFFEYTFVGKALTAAASNPRAARLVGIDVRRMGFISFALAGVLGGLAGVLITPTTAVSYYSDLPLALSGFAAAVFGGLRSPWQTLLGGIGLGVVGQLIAGYLGGAYQTEVALVLMLVVMTARHQRLSTEETK